MSSSFIAYIDESGDEGFRFPGSSEWFVLSALVLRRHTELETVKALDGIKVRLGKDLRRPLHFRDLEHAQRVAYVGELAAHRKRMRTISVLVHKPSLVEVDAFREKHLLYRYATRFCSSGCRGCAATAAFATIATTARWRWCSRTGSG